MSLISALPQYDPVGLKRAPIVLALAQLRFPAILSIQTDEKLIAQFQERVRGRYPLFAVGQQIELLFGSQGVTQQPTPARNWRFNDVEQTWTITVTTNSVALETRRYTDIQEFSERMLEAVSAAKETLGIVAQERIGLRYINEIRHPEVSEPSDWRKLINPTLLGPLSDDAITHNVQSSIQELRLAASDGSLVMRHGAAQGTTVAPVPGRTAPSGQFYLLDIDAFDEASRELDVTALDDLIRSYNTTIYNLFRWGISEQLFKYLEGARDA